MQYKRRWFFFSLLNRVIHHCLQRWSKGKPTRLKIKLIAISLRRDWTKRSLIYAQQRLLICSTTLNCRWADSNNKADEIRSFLWPHSPCFLFFLLNINVRSRSSKRTATQMKILQIVHEKLRLREIIIPTWPVENTSTLANEKKKKKMRVQYHRNFKARTFERAPAKLSKYNSLERASVKFREPHYTSETDFVAKI